MTLLTQCYYYELLSPSFFSFLSFQISATTLTNASPITTIVSLFIVFPPFSLGSPLRQLPQGSINRFYLYNAYCNTYQMFCQRLFLFFFQKNSIHDICMESHVIALPGCYLISTKLKGKAFYFSRITVSMPSRAVTSFLRYRTMFDKAGFAVVSMPSRAVTSFLQRLQRGKCVCR